MTVKSVQHGFYAIIYLTDLELSIVDISDNISKFKKGGQWLSGRVLDSRPKGSGFEPHRRHCVVVLEQDTFILA